MLDKLNSSVNVLSFVLILAGALVSLKQPEVGKMLVVGGLGVFGGGQLQKNA